MKNFLKFAYLCLAALAVIGTCGAMLYEGEWLFAASSFVYGVWVLLYFLMPANGLVAMPHYRDERQGKTFLWFILSALNLIGSTGYLIYHGYWLFAVCIAALVTLHVLEFLMVINLPCKDDY